MIQRGTPLQRSAEMEPVTFGGGGGGGLAGEIATLTPGPAGQSPGGGNPEGRPYLRKGSNNQWVTDLQQRLNSLSGQGWDWLDPDGAFGSKTDTAVRIYQGARALVADGVVGPLTWGALDADINVGAPTPGTQPAAPPTTAAPPIPAAPPTPAAPPSTKPPTGGTPKPKAPKADPKATTNLVADEEECQKLSATDVGAKVESIVEWSGTTDPTVVMNNLSALVCIPTAFRPFLAGMALVGGPVEGAQREVMARRVSEMLDTMRFFVDFILPTVLGPLPSATDPTRHEQFDRIRKRIDSLKMVITAGSSQTTDSKRLIAAGVAAAEVGKVEHKRVVDDGKRKHRFGEARLKEYFKAVGALTPTNIKRIEDTAKAGYKSCAIDPEPCDKLPSWCGMFVMYAHKQAGATSMKDWTGATGGSLNSYYTNARDKQPIQYAAFAKKQPQKYHLPPLKPGDWGERSSASHQGMIVEVKDNPGGGQHITTIEGNTTESGGSGVDAGTGGLVAKHEYDVDKSGNAGSYWNGFYRTGDLDDTP